MERSLSSILASKTLRIRKYAAKFRLADLTGAHRRLYLLQHFIDAHLILLDAFAKSRAHVLWWVGDDINFSPKFLLKLMGEFAKRVERHGVAAD